MVLYQLYVAAVLISLNLVISTAIETKLFLDFLDSLWWPDIIISFLVLLLHFATVFATCYFLL